MLVTFVFLDCFYKKLSRNINIIEQNSALDIQWLHNNLREAIVDNLLHLGTTLIYRNENLYLC